MYNHTTAGLSGFAAAKRNKENDCVLPLHDEVLAGLLSRMNPKHTAVSEWSNC
jgi:hypothetical protein